MNYKSIKIAMLHKRSVLCSVTLVCLIVFSNYILANEEWCSDASIIACKEQLLPNSIVLNTGSKQQLWKLIVKELERPNRLLIELRFGSNHRLLEKMYYFRFVTLSGRDISKINIDHSSETPEFLIEFDFFGSSFNAKGGVLVYQRNNVWTLLELPWNEFHLSTMCQAKQNSLQKQSCIVVENKYNFVLKDGLMVRL